MNSDLGYKRNFIVTKTMVFLHLRKFTQTNCFINILLYNKLSRLTESTAFTLAPLERASFTPNKIPILADSIKLLFYCKNKKPVMI